MDDGAVMPSRTQITLTPDQHRSARARSAALGISLTEYIRRLVDADLGGGTATADVSDVFDLGDSGGSAVAADKDRLLAEALMSEPRRARGNSR
jgi:hypothetical protein